jgi:hypothetical protein
MQSHCCLQIFKHEYSDNISDLFISIYMCTGFADSVQGSDASLTHQLAVTK